EACGSGHCLHWRFYGQGETSILYLRREQTGKSPCTICLLQLLFPRSSTLIKPMFTLTINGESRTLAEPLTVADLVERRGCDRGRLAGEVNQQVIPLPRHSGRRLARGDAVEIVTLVGGGSGNGEPPADKPLVIGKFRFQSRLITGTGKYASYELMR